ncbi:Ribonuclease 3 [Colletotrichum sp. SAR11_57]|nr:Ribonuclease 3 [Colletotrichum sp. SAR11_57]
MNPLQADQRMSDAEEILGYDFKDPRWLWEALQAAGSPVTRVGTRSLREGNKQLAGLGDRIISVVIVMTSVDDNISIGIYYFLKEAIIQATPTPESKLVGAVFKDGGLDAAEEVIEHLGIIDLLVTLQTPSISHTKSVIKMTLDSVLIRSASGVFA